MRVFATGGDLEEKSFLKKETTKRDWRLVRGCKSERILNSNGKSFEAFTTPELNAKARRRRRITIISFPTY